MVFDKLLEIFSNVIPEVDTSEITKTVHCLKIWDSIH